MISNLVLKVASRCNLNCSYCYMYNLGDTTYMNQPKFMSDEVVDLVIMRTKQYLISMKQSRFQFIFHGGEPLLVPKKWYVKFVNKVKKELMEYDIIFALQTNGVLYNEEWAKCLDSLNISVGFSWDGPESIHNKFRLYHNGNESYNDVINGMLIHKKMFGRVGGLSVLNAEVSAKDYYQNIKEIGIDAISILFPYYHHDMKNEYHKFIYTTDNPIFGYWLCELFDLWWSDSNQNKPDVLLFREFLALLCGFKVASESFGDEEGNVLVIETNGDIETSAALKSISNGFTKENNNLQQCSLKNALESPLVQLAYKSHKNLCETCLNCSISNICGGGRINQRFSKENNFNNPSIYCNDIKLIVSHIQNKVFSLLDEDELTNLNLSKLVYGEF